MTTTKTKTHEKVKVTPEWTIYAHQSVHEVLELMLGIKAEPCSCGELVPEMTAMIGLAGAVCGVMSIRCTRATAAQLASKMLNTEAVDYESDILDALGEICNMVAGGFKSRIPGVDEHCMLSEPTTVSGEDYKVHMPSSEPQMRMCVKCGGSHMEITLHTR